MKGIDTSRYQTNPDWKKVKKSGIEFVLTKATQGVNWIDPTYKNKKQGIREAGLLLGSYHFASAGDPKREADWFVKNVGEIQEGELIALDWETPYPDPSSWCRKFLDRVKERTGIKPLLYTNEARVKVYDWSLVVAGDYGLWVAKYGTNTGQMQTSPSSGQWKFWAIWQYTSRGKVDGIIGNVDLDYTTMDINSLKKYGKQPNQEEPGNSNLEEPLLQPIDKVYITQPFGVNPQMYAKYGMRGHNGIDYRTRFIDSPLGRRYVTAPKDGTIIELGNEGKAGYGIFVRMEGRKHPDGNEQHVFGHLKKWYVIFGQKVKMGELIALTDNTGASTGSHLHWGWRPAGWKKSYRNGFKGYEDQSKFII